MAPQEVVDPTLFTTDVVEFIDCLHSNGVSFRSAWSKRTKVQLGTHPNMIPFAFISLDDLLSNKRASARPKDLDDLAFLEGALKNQSE